MVWGEVFATGVAAGLAGALSVPASRRALLGNIKHDWLADELELDCILQDDQTVRLKSGGLFRIFQIKGTSYDAKIEQEQINLLRGRSDLIHQIGEKGLSIRIFGIKRQRDIAFEAKWPCPSLTEIGEAERRTFTSSYFVEWYLVVSARDMRSLIEASGKVTAIASTYRPLPLNKASSPEEPCPLTGFLNFLICGELRKDLPCVSASISGALPGVNLKFQADGLMEVFVPARQLHRTICVRQWPDTASGHLIAEILSLHGDIEISQICDPWDRDIALTLFKRKQIEAGTALIGNPALAAEAETVTNLLSEGNTTIFHTQLQVIVRAEDEQTLNRLVTSVCEILGRRRVVHSVETKGAPVIWFNRLPSVSKKKIKITAASKLLRPLILREENIAAIWTFQHSAVGLMKSPFGDRPVRFFGTPSGQAYAFQFHVSERKKSLGNFLVFAPSGGGKSTLLMHLLGGLAKFDGVRSYIFDSKEGARFMIETMGGVYQGYSELALNPLDVGGDTPENRHRVYAILKAMAAGVSESDEDEAIFAHAVNLAFQMDPPERTLNTIFPFAFEKRTALRRAFSKWVVDEKGNRGLNAHIFNAPHDALGGFLNQSHMVGINMNEALDDPVIGPPVVAHIASAIFKAASGSKGFTIFIDEAAKLLQNPGFLSLAKEMFREYRKLNGAVGLAFQDPAALFACGAEQAFIENAATLIFLPNSQAKPEHLRLFNLNDEQISFIMTGGSARPGERPVLVVKRDAATGFEESAILNVNLGFLGDAMRFYRSGPDENLQLANLKKQWGNEWLAHV